MPVSSAVALDGLFALYKDNCKVSSSAYRIVGPTQPDWPFKAVVSNSSPQCPETLRQFSASAHVAPLLVH